MRRSSCAAKCRAATVVLVVLATTQPVALGAAVPAVAATGPTAYVTDSGIGGGAVTPIDLTTNAPGTPIPVGSGPNSGPNGIAITPDGKTAYVANGNDNTVTPINLASGTPGGPIAVGGFPFGVAISPDAKTVYVANNNDNTVTPINVATNTPGANITVGNSPFEIAITPDGRTAYVSNTFDGTVTPINVATNTPGPTINFGPAAGPEGITVTPDGTTVYVVNSGINSVSPIDVATNAPGTPITVGSNPAGIAIAPDGKTAYVANNSDGTVTPIDLGTRTPGTPIAAGSQPFFIAIAPDGTTAYVTNQSTFSVTPINLATKTAGGPISAGSVPTGIAITPPSSTASTAKLSTQVSASSATGSAVTDTATLSGGTNPTGSITFSVFGPGDCSTAAVATSTVTVAGNGSYASSPFAPAASGTYHVVARYSGDQANLPAFSSCSDAAESFSATPSTNQVDLSAAVSGPASTIAGFPFTYTISATDNGPLNGPVATSGVVLTDQLPPGVTFGSAGGAAGAAGSCTQAQGKVTCSAGSLPEAMSATFTISVTPTVTGRITDTVTVSGSDPDPNPANNTATAATVVRAPVADLSITKHASATTLVVGQPLAYQISVANGGPDPVAGATVTDPLPSGVTFNAASGTGPCSQANGTVMCAVGPLATTSTATFSVVVTPTRPGTIVNTASIAGDEVDPNAANNSSSATTAVRLSKNWQVCPTGRADFPSLTGALASPTVLGGDSLSLCAATFAEGPLTIAKSLTVTGAGNGGSGATTITRAGAPGSGAIVSIAAGASVTRPGSGSRAAMTGHGKRRHRRRQCRDAHPRPGVGRPQPEPAQLRCQPGCRHRLVRGRTRGEGLRRERQRGQRLPAVFLRRQSGHVVGRADPPQHRLPRGWHLRREQRPAHGRPLPACQQRG